MFYHLSMKQVLVWLLWYYFTCCPLGRGGYRYHSKTHKLKVKTQELLHGSQNVHQCRSDRIIMWLKKIPNRIQKSDNKSLRGAISFLRPYMAVVPSLCFTYTRSAANRTSSRDSNPQPASCLPLGCWPSSTSELIASLPPPRPPRTLTQMGRKHTVTWTHTLTASAPVVLCSDWTICSRVTWQVRLSLLFVLYSLSGCGKVSHASLICIYKSAVNHWHVNQ